MKYQLTAPPSSTEQKLSFELPDLPTTITPVISGTTPIEPVPPVNQLPQVSAGADITIKLPKDTVTLTANANDPDGFIAGYIWEIVSGSGKLSAFDKPSIDVSGLTAGTTVAKVTVTDNEGGVKSDTVLIIVQPADVVIPPGDYGTLIYANGFDTKASLDPFENNQIGGGSLSTTIFKTGPGCFKSVPLNVSSGIRSEVQFPSSLTPTEGAIEYDVLYETIFQNNGHSLQFHPNTNGGSASPGLWHIDGKFVWVNWKATINTKYPTGFTIPKNKWMHIVFEYKMGSNGYMKFTIDGVVVLDKSNIQVGDGSGAYLKTGVNMWQQQASIVYYDNLKIWKK